jgi:hypothetical protein
VGDELIAGVAQLVGVVVAGKLEGAFDGGPVDLGNRDRYVAVGRGGIALDARR